MPKATDHEDGFNSETVKIYLHYLFQIEIAFHLFNSFFSFSTVTKREMETSINKLNNGLRELINHYKKKESKDA